MKSQQTPTEADQNTLIDEWMSRRPLRPAKAHPLNEMPDITFGIGVPMMMIGFMIGFFLFASASTTEPPYKEVLGTIGFFGMIVFPFAIPIIYVTALFVIGTTRRILYPRRMKKTGWLEYEVAYKKWSKERGRFYNWWPRTRHVTNVLERS